MPKDEYGFETFVGNFNIEFVGGTTKHVTIVRCVNNGYGLNLYLEGVDGTVYNWGTVISMKEQT